MELCIYASRELGAVRLLAKGVLDVPLTSQEHETRNWTMIGDMFVNLPTPPCRQIKSGRTHCQSDKTWDEHAVPEVLNLVV